MAEGKIKSIFRVIKEAGEEDKSLMVRFLGFVLGFFCCSFKNFTVFLRVEDVLFWNLILKATQLRKTDTSFLLKVKGEKLSRENWDLSYECPDLLYRDREV